MNSPRPLRFFDVEKNVKEYIEMREGLDGRSLIEKLRTHLKRNSTVIELGMGSGKDLDILAETFNVTGSDNSRIFVDLYKENNPATDVLVLDALTLDTDRKFDCIYSNKVLHHLKRDDLRRSFQLQSEILRNTGLLFHTFWKGSIENEFRDLNFIQYQLSELKKIIKPVYDLVDFGSYAEMNANDSVYLILKKKL